MTTFASLGIEELKTTIVPLGDDKRDEAVKMLGILESQKLASGDDDGDDANSAAGESTTASSKGSSAVPKKRSSGAKRTECL